MQEPYEKRKGPNPGASHLGPLQSGFVTPSNRLAALAYRAPGTGVSIGIFGFFDVAAFLQSPAGSE